MMVSWMKRVRADKKRRWLDSEHILNVETTDLSIVGWKAWDNN